MKRYITIAVLFLTTVVMAQNPITKDVGEFSEVKVFDLINVTMIKSDKNQVTIAGKNKRDVEVINKNGTLKIRMNIEESYDGNNTEIILYYSSVDTIDANEGAVITVNEILEQFEIELKAQEGGKITAQVKATETNIKAVTGGIINLSGVSKRQNVTIFTGGIYEAEEFKTESTKINVNAGGDARVNASELVQVKVRAGGDVYIYGNPKEIDEKRVLGGRVKRMQ
jgi:hypothetical protein